MRIDYAANAALDRLILKQRYSPHAKWLEKLKVALGTDKKISCNIGNKLVQILVLIGTPDADTVLRYLMLGLPIYQWCLVWDDGNIHSTYTTPQKARAVAYKYNKGVPRSGILHVKRSAILRYIKL